MGSCGSLNLVLQDLCPLSQQLYKEAQAHASKLESLNTLENLEKKKRRESGGNLPNVCTLRQHCTGARTVRRAGEARRHKATRCLVDNVGDQQMV